ncbi:MAG: polymer-forming cytoskeletal protein [Sulfurovum sp.]|nr:polymer-forming cytoskeletal protein [Sulfurovum sp.]MCB4753301.1 polymer-forming cytoskeletal protein [Sulfurovum sp.]
MAFFGKSKSEFDTEVMMSKVPMAPKNSATTIMECMEIQGNVKGCGVVHVDGKIHGDLTIDGDIIIGKEGVIHGNVSAKKIIISGKISGSTKCEALEVTQTGELADTIVASKIVSDGKLEAIITDCESIHITTNGQIVTKKMVGKNIVINGKVEGNIIATELLEISKSGIVKGEIQVKKIKVSEGGLMLGTMLTYEPSSPVRKVEKKAGNQNKETTLSKNEQATSLKEIVKTKEK